MVFYNKVLRIPVPQWVPVSTFSLPGTLWRTPKDVGIFQTPQCSPAQNLELREEEQQENTEDPRSFSEENNSRKHTLLGRLDLVWGGTEKLLLGGTASELGSEGWAVSYEHADVKAQLARRTGAPSGVTAQLCFNHGMPPLSAFHYLTPKPSLFHFTVGLDGRGALRHTESGDNIEMILPHFNIKEMGTNIDLLKVNTNSC